MTIYEEKPPRVEAVQWDGTTGSAEEVLDLVRKSNESAGFRITTHVDQTRSVGEGTTRLTFDRESAFGYIKDAGPREMYRLDWLIMSRDGMLKILPNKEFEAVYEEVDDG